MPFLNWQSPAADEARFLRTVLDHVSDCLVAVDTEGRIVLINRPYCKLLGGEEEDFVGRHITEVVSPKTRLHLVARGDGSVVGYPLEVRGHRLVTKQVPVLQDGEIIGALGFALFSDVEALQRTYSRFSQDGLTIKNSRNAWRATFSLDDIRGSGVEIKRLRKSIHAAAAHDFPVLLQGETGTGKELAAHAIHTHSARKTEPFVWINCASIPAELIEAELFGYEGGAFTGARTRGKVGKFELAKGGTLFLDEIGDMPLTLQSALLRALQSGEIVRVGGTSPVQVDIRIICATNRPLRILTDEGRFRRDLFYRLDVFGIDLPALRERTDKEELIADVLTRLARRHQTAPRELSPEQGEELLRHDWPGNVRELEGVLLRFLVTGEIQVRHGNGPGLPEAKQSGSMDLRDRVREERARAIEAALAKSNQNKEAAASLLGISRAQLYRELANIRTQGQEER